MRTVMPVWLQLTAALSAAAASGVMGIAVIPYLRRMRMCEPESPTESGKEAAGEQLRPTMCGILLVFGSLFGLVLSFALWQNFGSADRTSLAYQQEVAGLICVAGYAVMCAGAGFLLDWLCVRRRAVHRVSVWLKAAAVFLLHLAFLLLYFRMAGIENETVMDFGFRKVDAGILFYPLVAAVSGIFWMCAASMEEETDGMSISVGGVVALCITMLLLRETRVIPAIYTLTAAGACMGCLVWNLHPARCRLGRIGSFWISSAAVGSCILTGQYLAMLLLLAVYLLNRLPSLFPAGHTASPDSRTLQGRMKQAGISAWQQIGILTVFAAFCGIVAMLAYQ